MTSKKKRKKLKEQYNPKKTPSKLFNKDSYKDRELILNYLRNHPNEFIKGPEIINNNNLYFNTTGGVSRTVNIINNTTNYHIETKKGRNGGYIYYA